MQITESAANAILKVMSNNGLDSKKFLLNFETMENGELGFTFSRDEKSVCREFHGLRVIASENLDNMAVDIRDLKGIKGIVFSEQKGK
jgi:hypothetical protein